MTAPLTRSQMEALAITLELLLDRLVDDEGVVASRAMRYRIEGALAVLRVALGQADELVVGQFEMEDQ